MCVLGGQPTVPSEPAFKWVTDKELFQVVKDWMGVDQEGEYRD